MGKRRKKVTLIVSAVLAAVLFFISAAGGAFLLADGLCDLNARILPSAEQIDLSPLLAKETWTNEDVLTLKLQTGLSETGLNSVPREDLVRYQSALFFEGKIGHQAPGYFSSYDYLTDPSAGFIIEAPMVPLEAGDVLVSTSSHTIGWRHGHSALVVDPVKGSVLQCISIGMESNVYDHGISWFREAANFMVLRLKGVSAEERAAIAAKAAEELVGIPYSLTVGVLSSKNQCGKGAPKGTQCSHLVWQAFFNAGYDIDRNGGGVVTTHDIFTSPLFEIVQVYGFDPAEYLL